MTAGLPAVWRDDAYLRAEHAHAEVVAAWATGAALVAVLDRPGHGRGLVGLGEPDGIATLLARAVTAPDAVAGLRHGTLTRGAWDVADPAVPAALGLADGGSAWDWMWTATPLTAQPGEAARLPPGPSTAAEVTACLARAHPTAGTAPDDDRLLGWWGVRRDGRLVAVVGATVGAPGLPPQLVSLGVDPAARGRGLAGMVLGAAVRDCLAVVPERGPRMVSLGLYATNDVARRVYLRLGFVLGHRFESRRRRA